MKKYILYAGVNGAGKSTLYYTTHYRESMLRINMDEMVKSIGDWRNLPDIVKAGKLAKQRISKRVALGGHGISDADVERRYEESFANLKIVIPLCDLAAIYDNTERFRRFAIFRNGEEIKLSKRVPLWYSMRFQTETRDS